MTRKLVTEFIGTFVLVLSVGLSVVQQLALAPLAIGSALMIAVYMGGPVSGGHYNPAVSLAVLLRGKISGRDFVGYVLAQLVGAVVAATAVRALLGHTFVVAPGAGVGTGAALLAEFIFTFMLALVVLNTATAPGTEGNSYYGLAIGFTVMVGAFTVGGISGGAFNPAVGLGPALVYAAAGAGSIAYVWVLYLVGPLLGGAAAAGVFFLQYPEERAARAALEPAAR